MSSPQSPRDHRVPEKIADTIAKDAERGRFAKRLVALLKEHGIDASPTRLTAEFNARFSGRGVGTHTGRKWLLGEAIPTQEKLIVLAAMLGVQPDWLRYGDHNSLSAKRASADFVSSVAAAPYNRHELALINNYKKLPARDQRLLRVLVSEMLRAEP